MTRPFLTRPRAVLLVTGTAIGGLLACVWPGYGATLDSLTTRDPLGYVCVMEADLDAAMLATDKGHVLPQTCLPEPCRRQITRDELAWRMGRPPEARDWDRYVSRYADWCVAETGGAWLPDARPARRPGWGDFWGPILAAPGYDYADADRVSHGGSSGGHSWHDGVIRPGDTIINYPPAVPPVDTPSEPVPAVPLPAAGWGLLMGLAGMAGWKWRIAR